jgi:hypothetical protein
LVEAANDASEPQNTGRSGNWSTKLSTSIDLAAHPDSERDTIAPLLAHFRARHMVFADIVGARWRGT